MGRGRDQEPMPVHLPMVQQRAADPPVAQVTDNCEWPSVGAVNQTWLLCKIVCRLLATGPSISPAQV